MGVAGAAQRLLGDVGRDHARPGGEQRRREDALAAAEIEHPLARRDGAEQEGAPQLQVLGLEPRGKRTPDVFSVRAGHSCREAVRSTHSSAQRLCWTA